MDVLNPQCSHSITLINFKKWLALLLILSCCSRQSSGTISSDKTDSIEVTDSNRTDKIQTDSISITQQNYEKSLIHREFDNDSLLLDLPDLKRLVKSFTSKPKVREKKYGAGDYFGKYRVYADKLDTLVIDKGDGGDYGFGNTIYLIRREEVNEKLVTFKNGLPIFKERQMQTKEWSKLRFGNMKFNTIPEETIKYQQKALKEKLKNLYSLELIE